MIGGVGGAFVQRHGDIAVQQTLDLHGALRCQRVVAAVDVGAKGDALLIQASELGERHHLEAAAVGYDRARPAHEVMQAAQAGDAFGAWAQHQVIGVAEDDLRTCRGNLVGLQALDRASRANGHEGRRLDRAMRRR